MDIWVICLKETKEKDSDIDILVRTEDVAERL